MTFLMILRAHKFNHRLWSWCVCIKNQLLFLLPLFLSYLFVSLSLWQKISSWLLFQPFLRAHKFNQWLQSCVLYKISLYLLLYLSSLPLCLCSKISAVDDFFDNFKGLQMLSLAVVLCFYIITAFIFTLSFTLCYFALAAKSQLSISFSTISRARKFYHWLQSYCVFI